jgi:hypothetical protein
MMVMVMVMVVVTMVLFGSERRACKDHEQQGSGENLLHASILPPTRRAG